MDGEGAEMACEGKEMDFIELSNNGKASREGNTGGREKVCDGEADCKEIQFTGRWMTRSKPDVYGSQQTQDPSPMDHSDFLVDIRKRALVEFFSYKCLLQS